MSRSPVYNRVAFAASERRGYSSDLHERVDNLIQEWIENTGSIGYAASDNAYAREVESCNEYVKREYARRYSGPFGCPGFIVIAILSGIISWLVQRTLDAMFRTGEGFESPHPQ